MHTGSYHTMVPHLRALVTLQLGGEEVVKRKALSVHEPRDRHVAAHHRDLRAAQPANQGKAPYQSMLPECALGCPRVVEAQRVKVELRRSASAFDTGVVGVHCRARACVRAGADLGGARLEIGLFWSGF